MLCQRTLGIAVTFDASGSVVIDATEHCNRASQHVEYVERVWNNTLTSPQSCPSAGHAGAKRCMIHIIAGVHVPVLLQSLALSCHVTGSVDAARVNHSIFV